MKKEEELDGRSVFVNRICKLIYDKHNGDLDKISEEFDAIYIDITEYVKNVYELDNEIPMIDYYRSMKYGADNYGLDESEHEERIKYLKLKCKKYYETIF